MDSKAPSFWMKWRWRLSALFHRYWRKDEFRAEHRLWLAAEGDRLLRLQYPLDPSSTVFDVGGYHGDFTAKMRDLYGCRVHLFEPVGRFQERCAKRFFGDLRVTCHQFGLGDCEEEQEMREDLDASGAYNPASAGKPIERVLVRQFAAVFAELGVSRIDLLKINIEGGEFALLEHLIDSGRIKDVLYLQVQFHDFFPDAVGRRSKIRTLLARTHVEQWNYPFIWESWELRTKH